MSVSTALRTCEGCGVSLEGRRRQARHCSGACRAKAAREREQDSGIPPPPEFWAKLAEFGWEILLAAACKRLGPLEPEEGCLVDHPGETVRKRTRTAQKAGDVDRERQRSTSPNGVNGSALFASQAVSNAPVCATVHAAGVAAGDFPALGTRQWLSEKFPDAQLASDCRCEPPLPMADDDGDACCLRCGRATAE